MTVMLDLLLIRGTRFLASLGVLIDHRGSRTDTATRNEKRNKNDRAHRILLILAPVVLFRSSSVKL
jgi:hypothetical protein